MAVKTAKAVGKVQRFRAVLEKDRQSLGWTIARVPFEPAKVWTEMVRLRVRGSLTGAGGDVAEFRTSLFPDARGGVCLLVTREVQRVAGVGLGDAVEVELEPDLEPREAELPDALAVLLEEEPGLREYYDGLTEYTRREIGKWCVDVKSEEARMRRMEQMAERLLATMEAEKELPPNVAAAFRRRPKAKAGWAKMTPTQRRMELFAVTYYRTPEAAVKRVEKLCEVAEKKVGPEK